MTLGTVEVKKSVKRKLFVTPVRKQETVKTIDAEPETPSQSTPSPSLSSLRTPSSPPSLTPRRGRPPKEKKSGFIAPIKKPIVTQQIGATDESSKVMKTRSVKKEEIVREEKKEDKQEKEEQKSEKKEEMKLEKNTKISSAIEEKPKRGRGRPPKESKVPREDSEVSPMDSEVEVAAKSEDSPNGKSEMIVDHGLDTPIELTKEVENGPSTPTTVTPLGKKGRKRSVTPKKKTPAKDTNKRESSEQKRKRLNQSIDGKMVNGNGTVTMVNGTVREEEEDWDAPISRMIEPHLREECNPYEKEWVTVSKVEEYREKWNGYCMERENADEQTKWIEITSHYNDMDCGLVQTIPSELIDYSVDKVEDSTLDEDSRSFMDFLHSQSIQSYLAGMTDVNSNEYTLTQL